MTTIARDRRSSVRPLALTIAVLAVALTVAITPAAAATVNRGWVGTVPGTAAFVGVVIRGQAVTAYVCDGGRVGRWYAGRLAGGRATLRDPAGHRLTLRIARDVVTGAVDLPGRRAAAFTVVRARGAAGVFRRKRSEPAAADRPRTGRDSGWVRLNDGRIRGATTVTRLVVARQLTPTIAMFRRAVPATAGEGSAPAVDERLQAIRQSGPCFSAPRPAEGGRTPKPFTSGPTCGLPAPGLEIGVRRRRTRLLTPAASIKLPKAVVDRILRDIPKLADREQARILDLTGLPSIPPTLPATTQRKRVDEIARRMVADRPLTAAAAAYRRTRTPAEEAAYRALAGRYLDPVLGLVPRTELVALREAHAPPSIVGTFEQVYADGSQWFQYQDETLEGSDAVVTATEQFGILGDSLTFGNNARAGFHSDAGVRAYASLEIEVPAGAQAVEIETDGDRRPQYFERETCIGGTGWGATSMTYMLHARHADGTYDIMEVPVAGVFADEEWYDEISPPFHDCANLAPPVPPPPYYGTLQEFPTIRIDDPPAAGGRYLLTVGSNAHASTFLDGQAEADHIVGITKVVVRVIV